MKRILTISLTAVLLFTIAVTVSADRRRLLGARSVPAASACLSTDTTFSHGQFLEGFQTATTGYENTWAGSGGTVNAATDTTSLTTGKVTGQCDQAFSLAATATLTTRYTDFGAGVLTYPMTVTLMFYVDAQTDETYSNILTVGSSTGISSGIYNGLQFSRSGSAYQVRGRGTSQSAWAAITVNSWNTIVLRIDHTNATSSYINVNGGSNQTFDSDGAGGERYLIIGQNAFIGTPATGNLYFDLLCID